MRRLGLDIGTNSIGWCLVDYDGDKQAGTRIVDIGTRIFADGREPPKGGSVGKPLAAGRRLARGARRRRDRYIGRRSAFLSALVDHGLMPADADEAKLIAEGRLDRWRGPNGKLPAALPYELRVRALTERLEPYEIGRALFHLNQRRGFQSNRKAERRQKDGDDGKIATGARELDQAMHEAGTDTLGAFLAKRLAEGGEARVRMSGEAQLYDFYPQRRHVAWEFRRIWDAQAAFHPTLMTAGAMDWDELQARTKRGDDDWHPAEARDALYRILFYQRPLKKPDVGLCLFAGRHGIPADERRLPKAHPLFQERRLYEEVNQLQITAPGEQSRPLSLDQRDRLIRLLREKAKPSFASMAKELKLQPGESFNKASAARPDMLGDEIYAVMASKKRFGDAWRFKSAGEQWAIVERVMEEEDHAALDRYLTEELGLDEAHAREVARTRLPEGHGRLGETATRRIVEQLRDAVIPYSKAVELCGWHHSDDRTGEELDRLPYYGELLSRDLPPGSFDPADRDQPEKYWGKITNPTVHIGLRQVEKLVNTVIAVHGRPDQIVVELARELNLNDEEKKKHDARIRRDTAEAQRRSRLLTGLDAEGRRTGDKIADDTGANRALLKLWEELAPASFMDRCCPYCGKTINISTLFGPAVQVDHILPYSTTWDDSAANKVVAHRACNQEKANQTPYKAWGHLPERWETISNQVRHLARNKQWRFAPDAMQRFDEKGGFLARQLKDTQYLSRLAGKYLRSLYPDKGEDSGHVYVITGQMTAMLRRLWNLNEVLPDHNYVQNPHSNAPKNRLDHRHHAIDAAVTAVTTRSLLQAVARAAARAEDKNLDKLFEGLEQPWEGFRDELREKVLASVVSHKPDHGRKGVPSPGHDVTAAKLHDDTAYGLTGEMGRDGKTPVVVKRVSFRSLDQTDIADPDRIRDTRLRDELRAATEGLSGARFQEALDRFARQHEHFRGIRHVRVLGERAGTPTLSVIPVRDRTGRAYKAYKGNANARFIVWQLPDGGWKHGTVSTFAAHQVGHAPPRPHPAARKVLDLRQDDLLAVERDGAREIMRVVKFSEKGQVTLAAHNEAGPLKARDATSNDLDPFKYVSPTAGGLRKLKARQVRIDPLGRIFDPGPR